MVVVKTGFSLSIQNIYLNKQLKARYKNKIEILIAYKMKNK